jgi:hypothetical protein
LFALPLGRGRSFQRGKLFGIATAQHLDHLTGVFERRLRQRLIGDLMRRSLPEQVRLGAPRL